MPELITIAGGMTGPRKVDVRLPSVSEKDIRKVTQGLKLAKMSDALEWLRSAFMALRKKDYRSAALNALEASILASALYRQDPKVTTQIIAVSRKLILQAAQRILEASA